MRNGSVIGRIAALAALVIAVAAVGIILLSGSSGYQVKAIFENASQIVTGDQVEVAGNSIGSVSNIALTPDGRAELTLSINNSQFTPLHRGTEAIIRQPGLSSIAARYVDLNLGSASGPAIPSGGTIDQTQTQSEVDLDELFNALNGPTRKGLQNVFQGSAASYQGRGQQAQLAWEYLNPQIATASLLFHELNRDTSKFTRFIVNSSNLVTTLAQRQGDLSGLVSHLSTTFTALARQQTALGQSVQRLPPFMRLANTTFVNLRNSLVDLTNLINATKTVANPAPGYPRGKLYALLQQLEPLAIQSVPTIRDLANVISKPGANNDLIDLNKLAPAVAQATVAGEFGEPMLFANGAERQGAFPVSANALQQSAPEMAVARPYAVDLTGWFEGYSHPGLYDANGSVSRIAPVVGVGSIQNGVFNIIGSNPITNPLDNLLFNPQGRAGFASSILTTGQGDRCPGSMERGPQDPGSSATSVESGFPCSPNQVPTGQ
ncbi:MAG TPA: MlaD family protein [Solirubrobacteraceae bacterium]|nr:MlaD family protein [Solirubrobacteraceae bacterium]